jgi:hypothetical protein
MDRKFCYEQGGSQMTVCIDLKAKFGERYQVFREESGQAKRCEGRHYDPWLLTIACRHGHIYPHGADYLAVSTNHRARIANRLAALPGVRIVQDGDDGINAIFHVDDFDEVAAIMKPRRRRRLTPGQRTEREERLRKYQFAPATHDAGGERRRDPIEKATCRPR